MILHKAFERNYNIILHQPGGGPFGNEIGQRSRPVKIRDPGLDYLRSEIVIGTLQIFWRKGYL
jgi:hypothetical protein